VPADRYLTGSGLPHAAARALDACAVEAHISPRDRAIALILYYAAARSAFP
jgi:hypothetical protein